MLPSMLASVFAWQLEAALRIPVFVTYAIGYGIMAAVIFRHARGVWAKAAKEKCEMQKRFEAEDAALFGAPKNNRM